MGRLDRTQLLSESHAHDDSAVRVGDDWFDRAAGFLRTLEVIELGLAGAISAGTLDGRHHAGGAPLSARDTLVASPAREHGYTLVTRDRDVADIPDLDLAFDDE